MRYLALLLFTACASFAHAQNSLIEWGQTGDWSILVDTTNGNGCLMRKDYQDGIRIEFGYVPNREGGFFAAYSKTWTQIDAGTTGVVRFITDEAKFAGEVEMLSHGDWYGGWAFFNNPNLVVEVAQRRSMTVIGPKGGSFDINLDGTNRAIQSLKECQAKQS